MLYNTSYTNKDDLVAIDQQVGKGYSFFEKLKMGSIGSSRLMVEAFSPALKPKARAASDIHYANIELRPKGIIVHFTNGLDRFSWVVSYYQLVVYNADFFSIHAAGQFIQFRKNKNYGNNKKFIKKMMALKTAFLDIGEHSV